jgi:gamma-glutamylcyclotransferase (GGCT)/AIG2-like uncharacterized protein YtfP
MSAYPFFVYGTLRRGQGNYRRLLAGRTTAEISATLPGHALYGQGLPYAVAAEASAAVVGDLMFLDAERYDEVLADLDRLEGYRPGRSSFYVRQAVTVRIEGGEETAWVYLAGPETARRLSDVERIDGGDWLAYDDVAV